MYNNIDYEKFLKEDIDAYGEKNSHKLNIPDVDNRKRPVSKRKQKLPPMAVPDSGKLDFEKYLKKGGYLERQNVNYLSQNGLKKESPGIESILNRA